MSQRSDNSWTAPRRWMHRAAVFTAVFTFVLLLSGGQVTSYDVGMAVPDWPTTFGQNMFLAPWLYDSIGVFIEHRHRLIGAGVGMLAIGLTAGFWTVDRGGVRAWTATAALAFIVFQGLLGGQRVLLNSLGIGRELAVFHGVFAQICFATVVSLVVVSSRSWRQATPSRHPSARTLRTVLNAACLFVPAMIAFGAVQRHLGHGFVIHLALAGAWVLFVIWLNFTVYLDERLTSMLGAKPALLAGLTLTQLFLGLGALWATQLLPPEFRGSPTPIEALLPTLHLAVGALIFAITVATNLRLHRRTKVESVTVAARDYALEGVG